ncbi:DUF456 domain-containing protein [Brevibacillus choshinensis]|uniref:DUF456 domain-containing protein n=1 Tax=Brevibacillus choshinensis TaxID=54911 RepID=A0ABX7FIP8_BRECH|nr:DUF456 domain-containing protein [Brevibacillus choshinensis]QRG66106.1 DUF456 domain-containing protein [Brevibacillus choshinensis]
MSDCIERMTAKRKEDTGFSETVDLHDTEFAADTWTEKAFDDDDKNAAIQRIQYDPYTRTERYNGELGKDKNDFSERLDGVDRTQEEVYRVSSVRDRDTETAAEIAEPIPVRRRSDRVEPEEDSREGGASGIGMTGLGLSILSLFLMPYLIAPIGMVLGYLAYRRNSRTLGAWAMIVGAIAILGALIIYPFYTAR